MRPFQSKLLAPALLLACMPVACKFGPEGVTWFWSNQPIVAGMLGLSAAILWGVMYLAPRRHPGH